MVFILGNLATKRHGVKEYKQIRINRPKPHQQNANTTKLLQNRSALYLKNGCSLLIEQVGLTRKFHQLKHACHGSL